MTGNPLASHLIVGIGALTAHRTPAAKASSLTPSQRQTLAALIAQGPRGATAETLADAIWPGDFPGRWQSAVRMALSRIRPVLPPDAVPRGSYRLDLAVEQVDLWHLTALADQDRVPTERELLWVLAGQPCPDVELSAVIGQAVEAAKRAQRRLVDRFCRAGPVAVSNPVCDRLLAFVASDPIDEHLAASVGRVLIDAGHAADAYRALRSFSEGFSQEMGTAPAGVEAVIGEARQHLAQSAAATGSATGITTTADVATAPPAPAVNRAPLPAALAALRGHHCAGRGDELALLQISDRSLVLGPRGAGKSRLLARIADEAIADGAHVTYLAAAEDQAYPFAAFLAAFPALRPVLSPPSDDQASPTTTVDDEPDARQRALLVHQWQATLAAVERLAGPGGTHWVLVDDAQWLDSSSLALLRLLARSSSDHQIRICIAGRSDSRDSRWMQFSDELRKLGFVPVELGGLSLDALVELTRLHHPSARDDLRHALAVEVLALSGGLPVAAVPLITSADPRTLTIPERIGAAADLRWIAEAVPSDVRDIGIAAAVLGHEFSLSVLIDLLGRPPAVVEDALDHLIDAEVLVITDDLDRLRFRHVLLGDAFLGAAPPFRVRKLHRDAAVVANGDVHAVARHLALAVPMVPHSEAARALIRSARAHAATGQWRDAANQLRRAEVHDPDALTLDDLILQARSLDLSGLDDTNPRRRAHELAAQQGLWPLALAAAVAGLPGAEHPDGDPGRLALLEAIPANELPGELRFDHAAHLARHASLNGSPDTARRWVDEAEAMAQSSDQIVQAHLLRWTVNRHIVPDGDLLPAHVIAAATGATGVRITQFRMITALQRNELAACRDLHTHFARAAAEFGDPLRIWHAMVFEALLATEDGQFDRSTELAEAAYRYGLLHGLGAATTVRLGQVFTHQFALRRHAALLDAFDLVGANVQQSTVAQASLALSLWAAGKPDDAIDLAGRLITSALSRPRSLTLNVVGLLAEIIGAAGTPQQIDACRQFLLPFRHTSPLVGFGIAGMGPAARYLAHLAGDDNERVAWLRSAVDASDQLGSVTWQILNRINLALASIDEASLVEARRLAQGTDLPVDEIADRWREPTGAN